MGKLTIINDVDYSTNRIKKINIFEQPNFTYSSDVLTMYNNYITTSGIPDNVYLLALLQELKNSNVLSKAKYLLYLKGNLQSAKTNIVNSLSIGVTGIPIISENTQFFSDKYFTINNLDLSKGLLNLFMIDEIVPSGFHDFGAPLASGELSFSAKAQGDFIVKAGTTYIQKTLDDQEELGVYLVYTERTKLVYKHNSKDITKTITNVSANTNWSPMLGRAGYPGNSSGKHRFYGAWNEDLTPTELNSIQSVFEKYKPFI